MSVWSVGEDEPTDEDHGPEYDDLREAAMRSRRDMEQEERDPTAKASGLAPEEPIAKASGAAPSSAPVSAPEVT
eukprot:726372-Lingulodinium_polyedra.AAC.1